MLEKNFPQAVGITGHFVVALAIGRAPGKPDLIFWWDPSDAKTRTQTVASFIQQYEPAFAVAKVP